MENIQQVREEIEAQYQQMCHEARKGGAATIDEVANVLSSMCKLAECVAELSKKVSLQDLGG
ncbi:MAG TPA: hypothetical protein VHV10_13665 [Ktedonobacteraceae bacterium]|jgi:hypothetical protein|nr:hypothetical protein [Ktedonobacteraceae bacterium]